MKTTDAPANRSSILVLRTRKLGAFSPSPACIRGVAVTSSVAFTSLYQTVTTENF